MTSSYLRLALLAGLLSPAVFVEDSSAATFLPSQTVRVGGIVSVDNPGPDWKFVTPEIDGVPGDIIAIPPGGCRDFTVPRDNSLIGKTLEVDGESYVITG